MTHLKIIQNNTLADTEEVSQEIIQKLYDLAVSGDLDAEMKGRLHLTAGYRAQAEYLHQMFPNLIISIDDYIIPFEDPKMVTYLNSIGVGSNGVITEADAAAATVVANSQNTEVTKFNELKYFTSITQSRGGVSSSNNGWVQFYGWTALEEVDISNFTSIGHDNGYGWEDSFRECSSLKKVTASNKLHTIGWNGFYSCKNLEEISNLDGTITVYRQAFCQCWKLKNQCFDNVEVLFPATSGQYSFFQTRLITSLTLSNACTNIPSNCFEESYIETINMPQNVVTINDAAFKNSKINSIDLSKLTTIAREAFYNCSSLTTVNLSNVTRIDTKAFEKSGLTGNISLPSITSIEERVFCDSKITSLDFTGSSITAIPGYLCWDVSTLTNVTLPTSCTEINTYAFKGCSALTSADLSSVTTIGSNAFEDCTSLSGELNMPTLTTLNGYGQYFRNCRSLTKVKCLGKIDTINAGMFQCSSGTPALQEVYLPYECTTIKNDSFVNCTNLATIKQYNKSIDQYADDEQPVFNFISRITNFGLQCFKNCSSLTLTANDVINAVTIGVGAFSNSGLSGDLSFPHLETLGSYPFQGCSSITSVDLTGSTVTTIGGGFINQSPCDHIILPDTLTKIDGSDNFYSPVLRWIKLPCTTPPTLNNSNCFRNMPNTTKIYVPDASLSAYRSAEIWSSISTQIRPLSDFATDFPNG